MAPARRMAAAGVAAAVGLIALLVALLSALPRGSPPDAGTADGDSPGAVGAPGGPGAGPATVRPSVTSPSAPDADAASDYFSPGPYEVHGEIKKKAGEFVTRVGTWRDSEPTDPVARLAGKGYPANLVTVAEPLLDGSAREATTTVEYLQYGGLADASASVIVIARQEQRTDVGHRVRELALDVRMARTAAGTWEVTAAVVPPRPPLAPPRPGGPTRLGSAVLENRAIRIPATGRADIRDRRVDDRILSVITELSRTYTLDVDVFVSGHPGVVFPTPRLSNHAVGRAVDIRAINGRLVSAIPRDDPVLSEFMIAAGRAGATEVAGPIKIPGRGFLSDEVHQDHVHLGITPTEPPAKPTHGR